MSRLADASPPAASLRGLDNRHIGERRGYASRCAWSAITSRFASMVATQAHSSALRFALFECFAVAVSGQRRRYGVRACASAGSDVACGSRGMRGSCGTHPLRPPASLLHNAALPSVPASRYAKAPRGAGHRFAPRRVKATGVMQSGLRWSGRTAVGAPRSLARPTRRHLRALVVVVALWHQSGAARIVLVSGLRPVMWCVPPPALWLRRCAASALRAGLPVRPPRGLPQPAPCWPTKASFSVCYQVHRCMRAFPGGYRPKRPASQPPLASIDDIEGQTR